jgi:hypothetical protein
MEDKSDSTDVVIASTSAVAVTPRPSATPMELIDRALSSGADVETLGKLMDLQERWERSQGRKTFDTAMSRAKSSIPPIRKNRSVGYATKGAGKVGYKHEDMAEIARTIDPILAKEGLSYRFRTSQSEKIQVTCVITHRDGHYEETSLSCGPDVTGNKNPIQAIGSTVTYLQRYTLKSALGLSASSDDDGNLYSDETFISDNQRAELMKIAEDVGANIEKFCKVMEVSEISSIHQKDFQRAKELLETKRKS